jgi:hypothetical protein
MFLNMHANSLLNLSFLVISYFQQYYMLAKLYDFQQ